jgi:hypothetical protein
LGRAGSAVPGFLRGGLGAKVLMLQLLP